MRKIGRRTLLFPLFALFCHEQSHDPLSLEFSTEPTLQKKTVIYIQLQSISFWLSNKRRMRLTGHVAGMGSGRGVRRVLVGISEGRRHLEDLIVDGKIILKWLKWGGETWTGLLWLRIRTGGGRLSMRH